MDDYYDEYQNFQPVVGFHQPIVVKEESKKDQGQNLSKIPGIPGIDYPIYHTVPSTSFSCAHVPIVPGMYANVETGCQVHNHISHSLLLLMLLLALPSSKRSELIISILFRKVFDDNDKKKNDRYRHVMNRRRTDRAEVSMLRVYVA